MMGRRSAALLCVLLAHALFFLALRMHRAELLGREAGEFESEPITIDIPPVEEVIPPQPEHAPAPAAPSQPRREPAAPAAPAAATASTVPSAVTPPARVDWPLEGKKSAERVLAQEAEAERIAKMFAGPDGTWASLTRRQRSELNKFRWKKGVAVEYDADGNLIYRINDGCMIINGLIACKLGKAKINDHMFDNMREYFDELRLPETDVGNGTEPEARRPAN
jgi:hypothetical protein